MAKFKLNLAGYFKYRLLKYLLEDICDCERRKHNCDQCIMDGKLEDVHYCCDILDYLEQEARQAWKLL